MRGAGLAAVVALAMSGCGKAKDEPKGDTPAAPKAPVAPVASDTCKKDVAAFAQWYGALYAAGRAEIDWTVKHVEADLPAAWVPEVDALDVTPTFLGAWDASDGVHDYTQSLDDKALPARLAETHAKTGSADDHAIRVDVSNDVPWSRVVGLVEAIAKAGYQRAHFVVKVKGPEAPAPSAMHDEIVAHVFDVQEKLYDQCPAWGSYYFRRVPGGRTVRQLREEESTAVPAAIEQCGCAVDLAAAREYVWALDVGNGAFRAPVTIELAEASLASASKVEQPKGAPWSEAVAAVTVAAKAGQPVRLAIR